MKRNYNGTDLEFRARQEKMIALGETEYSFAERIELQPPRLRNRRLHNGGRVMTYKMPSTWKQRKINKAEALLKEIKNTYEV
jgi:hypothetical protein